jgi:hypothetical protein
MGLRRALLPWLCALLLAAQHEVGLHALQHLDAHPQPSAQHDADAGCLLCLACAAAAQLAPAAANRLPQPHPDARPADAPRGAGIATRAPEGERNRGPPARA